MWIVIGIAVFLLIVAVYALGICKAAGDADRRLERMRLERQRG